MLIKKYTSLRLNSSELEEALLQYVSKKISTVNCDLVIEEIRTNSIIENDLKDVSILVHLVNNSGESVVGLTR